MKIELHLKYAAQYQMGELLTLGETIDRLKHELKLYSIASDGPGDEAMSALMQDQYPPPPPDADEPEPEDPDEPVAVRRCVVLDIEAGRSQIESIIFRMLPSHLIHELRFGYV